MKTLPLFLMMFAAAAVPAMAKEKKEGVAFPRAIIAVEGPDQFRSSACISDILPKGLELTSASGIEGTFVSRTEGTGGKKSGSELAWRHVAQTECGDIYLLSFTKADGKREAGCLLFDGNAQVSWRGSEWLVSISQKEANQSPAQTAPGGRGSP
jgi:hypothetical protein